MASLTILVCLFARYDPGKVDHRTCVFAGDVPTSREKKIITKASRIFKSEKTVGSRVKEQSLALLRQCMGDAQTLVGFNPIPEESSEPPSAPAPTATAAPTQPGGEEGEQAAPTTERKSPAREQREKSTPRMKGEVPEDKEPDIPFTLNKTNLYSFERLYDPSLGSFVSDIKMLRWLMQFYP